MNTSKTIPAILTERQIFYISEFDVEAAWLSFMHREGWKMLSTTGFKYRFESCPKENWTYQLDFRADGVSEEEYIQMYREIHQGDGPKKRMAALRETIEMYADYGWEFVPRFRQWYYFRKPYSESEDMSIFSDNASKIEMCRSIIRQHALLVTPMILILLAYLLLYFTTDLFPGPGGGFPGGFFMGLAAAAGPVLIIAGGFVLNQLYRLKKMIDRLGNPA